MVHQKDKKITIFAHYDKQSIVDDYVILYLQNLKKFCDIIIFVSDGNLSDQEKNKVLPITADIIATPHGEYDFGSYKRGFNFLKEKYNQELLSADLLVFANDSCYSVGDLQGIFDKINQKPEIDFFGITDSTDHSYHLESYFLVFRNNIFTQNYFDLFMQSIQKEKSKDSVVIKYEVGISNLLKEHNKRMLAFFGKEFLEEFIRYNRDLIKTKVSKIIGWYQKLFGMRRIYDTLFKMPPTYIYSNSFYVLLLSGCPFLKKSIPLRTTTVRILKLLFNSSSLFLFWEKIINNETNFDSKIIADYNDRILHSN